MSKKLHILLAQPDDLYFWWQLKVFLTNARKYDLSKHVRILLFRPHIRVPFEIHPRWKELNDLFPEAQFFWYKDVDGVCQQHIDLVDYLPLLRPFCLKKHFAEFPELVNDAIYYTDSDTCFTKFPVFLDTNSDFVQNNNSYLSYTGKMETGYNYQGPEYLDGKTKDVKEDKLLAYKQIDIVEGLTNIFGMHREDMPTDFGGVQYLLKNIDTKFWEEVYSQCIYIKSYFRRINSMYFASEEKGIQSWCSDLWAIHLNLVRHKNPTSTPKEMRFAWASDPIQCWKDYYIYHDAGHYKEAKLFNKREQKYITNTSTPFEDDLSWVNPEFCSFNYIKELQEAGKLN